MMAFQPDLIAVSTTETTFHRGLTLISEIRDLKILNIFGGVFCTFAPDLVMSFEDIDMCCVGEGENAIVDLAAAIAKNEKITNVTNIWIRENNGTIIKNNIRFKNRKNPKSKNRKNHFFVKNYNFFETGSRFYTENFFTTSDETHF